MSSWSGVYVQCMSSWSDAYVVLCHHGLVFMYIMCHHSLVLMLYVETLFFFTLQHQNKDKHRKPIKPSSTIEVSCYLYSIHSLCPIGTESPML
jgi:hypothetical protein